MTGFKIGIGSEVSLKRDPSRMGEVIGLRRLGRTLYATVAWGKDQSWTTSAPTSEWVQSNTNQPKG